MAVAALSTAGFQAMVSASSSIPASQRAWQSLQASLAAGNLTSAQSALNAYNRINQAGSEASTATSSAASSSSSQMATDLASLGSAIGSGNVSSAQSAFATVQNDLKSSPPQAVTNAESAVTQTVQWMDDLLTLSSSGSAQQTPIDPTMAILDSAYGTSTAASAPGSTDAGTAILDSAYGSSAGTGAGDSTGGNVNVTA